MIRSSVDLLYELILQIELDVHFDRSIVQNLLTDRSLQLNHPIFQEIFYGMNKFLSYCSIENKDNGSAFRSVEIEITSRDGFRTGNITDLKVYMNTTGKFYRSNIDFVDK